MRRKTLSSIALNALAAAAALALGLAAGCAPAATAPPQPAGSPAPSGDPASPLGSPFRDEAMPTLDVPLVLDRGDLRIGTTVQYYRIPSASELHDLTQLPGLSRVVLSFEAWPREYAPLEVLNRMPEGVETLVIVKGWPPARSAVDLWNYLSIPLRIVVVVPGPPSTPADVANLNELRALERVIAQMDEPARAGFERLQRPLSFRKLVP